MFVFNQFSTDLTLSRLTYCVPVNLLNYIACISAGYPVEIVIFLTGFFNLSLCLRVIKEL